jgi:hypothetical protein
VTYVTEFIGWTFENFSDTWEADSASSPRELWDRGGLRSGLRGRDRQRHALPTGSARDRNKARERSVIART